MSMTTAPKGHRGSAAAVLVAISLFAGCRHHSGLDRLPVHGEVTAAGGEKINGMISFQPAAGRKGPAANASIKDGKYHFDRSNGPIAGPTKVIVKRILSRQEQMAMMTSKKPKPPRKGDWSRGVDIADDGQYVCDFTIEN
jgi:hypothetical protein